MGSKLPTQRSHVPHTRHRKPSAGQTLQRLPHHPAAGCSLSGSGLGPADAVRRRPSPGLPSAHSAWPGPRQTRCSPACPQPTPPSRHAYTDHPSSSITATPNLNFQQRTRAGHQGTGRGPGGTPTPPPTPHNRPPGRGRGHLAGLPAEKRAPRQQAYSSLAAEPGSHAHTLGFPTARDCARKPGGDRRAGPIQPRAAKKSHGEVKIGNKIKLLQPAWLFV